MSPIDLPWHWVFGRAYPNTITPIEVAWSELLSVERHEAEILRFLGDHPHFFLVRSAGSHFVLKEIRLGGEFTIDFVVPTDEASVGVTYELIEIERPDTPPFRKDGVPTERLSRAIQQVLDWKAWLETHRPELHHMFPAPAQVGPGYEYSFNYTVIIGTRQNSLHQLSRRNDLAKATGISIRSFDSLTDQLSKAIQPLPGPLTDSHEARSVSYDIATILKNPFYRAFGDAEWRNIRGRLHYHPHLVATNAGIFAEARSFNRSALGRFEAYCESQPPEDVQSELTLAKKLYAAAIVCR